MGFPGSGWQPGSYHLTERYRTGVRYTLQREPSADCPRNFIVHSPQDGRDRSIRRVCDPPTTSATTRSILTPYRSTARGSPSAANGAATFALAGNAVARSKIQGSGRVVGYTEVVVGPDLSLDELPLLTDPILRELIVARIGGRLVVMHNTGRRLVSAT